MPALWPYFLLLVPAVFLVRDDFRTRTVSVVWLAVLGVIALAAGWTTSGLWPMLRHAVANTCLLVVLAGALCCWQSMRGRPFGAFFSTGFGAGDAVLALVLVPLFSPVPYLRFLLLSALVAVVWWLQTRASTIPLAGFMALLLAVYAVFKTAGIWN